MTKLSSMCRKELGHEHVYCSQFKSWQLNISRHFRPGSVGTVTHEEKEQFTLIKERLRVLLEQQITNFRFCFPFGRPEGALKSTLMLMERVRFLSS